MLFWLLLRENIMVIDNNENNVRSILEEHQFFSGLNPTFLKLIEDSASIETFDSHDYLFYEGDPAPHFYLVLEGLIGIQIFGGEAGFINIQKLCPGEIIGWSWLLPPYNWFFSGEVLESCRVVKFDGEKLRNICDDNHDFGYEMARRLTSIVTQRLSETRSKLVAYKGSKEG